VLGCRECADHDLDDEEVAGATLGVASISLGD